MNNELKQLDDILKEFPMDPFNKDNSELVLSEISLNQAFLIWKYAQKYLTIAKEVEIV